uniref:VP91 n=1 Tax=Adoxophyes orana granulovirus TaxID=170617 RepID=A0A0A7V4Z4_GVAO|nr:VP91 [Adoxophyes orana granulovirus]
MLSLSNALLIVVLLVIVILFYSRVVVDDFDTNSYVARLNILKEYLHNNKSTTIPSTIGYVSHVNGQQYYVTYFDTKLLKETVITVHDSNKHVFNFNSQTFDIVLYYDKSPSVSKVADSDNEFIAHVDDGNLIMKCNNGTFNGERCVEESVCNERSDINLPLTEDRLNKLIFNKVSARKKPLKFNTQTHPTAYVHCDQASVPAIVECPNGQSFKDTVCVDNPTLINNYGIIYKTNLSKQQRAVQKYYKMVPIGDINNTKNLFLKHNSAKKKLLTYDNNNIDITQSFANVNKPSSILMLPVNSVHIFDAYPCAANDKGHTFKTDNLGMNQYLECLDGNNLFLHTCENLTQASDGRYSCDVDIDCLKHEDGTGETIHSLSTNNITFPSGITFCNNYKVHRVIECDTGDFVADKNFNHPINMKLNVALPKQTYDSSNDKCVDYSVQNVDIQKDYFKIDFDEYPLLSYGAVGRISKIISKNVFNKSESINDFVTYAKSLGEIAVDPETFHPVDCLNKITFDILDNTRYNVCDDNNTFIEQKVLQYDQYIDPNDNSVRNLKDYNSQCIYNNEMDPFSVIYRDVDGYRCKFTLPLID